MQDEPGDRQIGGFIGWQNGHETVFIRDCRRLRPEEGSSVQKIERLALVTNRDSFDDARESHPKIPIPISHELDPFRNREWNTRKEGQSQGQVSQGGKICFAEQQTGSLKAAVANGCREIGISSRVSFTDCRICSRSSTCFRSAGQTRLRRFSMVAWSAWSWVKTNLISKTEITAIAAVTAEVGVNHSSLSRARGSLTFFTLFLDAGCKFNSVSVIDSSPSKSGALITANRRFRQTRMQPPMSSGATAEIQLWNEGLP